MCDCKLSDTPGWLGWNVPEGEAVLEPADGPWVDLSHPLNKDMPRVSFLPAPEFNLLRKIPEHLINVTHMSMVVHTGTHVDAPRHLFNDAPAFHEIPVSRLSGSGVVWRVDTRGSVLIEPEHLEGAAPLLKPGDILVLDTGMHKLAGTDAYNEEHPSLSEAAAQWVLNHGVKFLGIDFPTPDAAVARRKAEFNYPIHRLLLGNGVLIAEHLTNLDTLSNKRVEIVSNALNITNGDGAPVRILARPLRR